MTKTKHTIYFFSSTHWDREWCQSFQGFRNRLVTMMNEMIDFLETNEDFRVFHMDGQTILLEDFLEIESGKRERLAKLISDKRLLIGPWYVMPDELLLSGESLIRNLLIGDKICQEWNTEFWKYGYLCDMFGHIAQMPQILNGFDIRYAVVGRGTNEHTHPAHMIWQAPDGSECITFKLNDFGGYGNFAHQVGYEFEKRKLTVEQTRELVGKMIEYEKNRSPLPISVIMDGNDHQHIRKETKYFIDLIHGMYPDTEVKHVNLVEMGKHLEAYRKQMPVHKGEIYDTAKKLVPYNHVIRHTLSSRYPLKQANDQIQTLLEKWVDPFAVIGDIEGISIQQAYIDLAYKHLIQNHPHDSICGCSIDQVHKDMEYRFDQARMLAENAVADVFDFIKKKRYGSLMDPGHRRVLTIWNPMPFARKEVMTLAVDFQRDYPCQYAEPFGYEMINSFKIYDHLGNEIPYGLQGIQRNYVNKIYNKTAEETVDRYTVSMEVAAPPMGTCEYKIVPFEASSRYLDRISKDERVAENEYIKVKINDNGTLKIYDKRSGKTYDQLMSYLDDGEIGDGWYHANPVEDRLVSSLGSECTIEKVENGPSRAVFKITHLMKVPEEMEWQQSGIRRSPRSLELKIISLVGLSRGAEFIDVETTITNNARDHRLRLKLPTGIDSPQYFVNQSFAFVERKTGIDVSTQEWREFDVPEKQTGGIVGKRAGDGSGLALVSAYGLHECSGMDDDQHTITVTLYRSFKRTIMTNGEEGGQILGDLHFKYALTVLQPETTYADLIRLQDCHQANMRADSQRVPDDYEPTAGKSYFEISNSSICLSVLKRPVNGGNEDVIIRLYNMSNQASSSRITCCKELMDVVEVNLKEEDLRPIEFDEQSFEIRMDAWKILSCRLRLKKAQDD